MTDSDLPAIDEYRLTLDIDFEALLWSGSVEFDLPLGREELRLDAEDIEIVSVIRNRKESDFYHQVQAGKLEIPLLSSEPSNLRIDFRGVVVPQRLDGLYRCRQGDGFILTTQCQQVSARRIFPCIDRPDRKARIALSVHAPAALEVVSNTAVDRTLDLEGRKEWVFVPSPPMATYLFYLAVGQFDHAEARKGRVPIRVLTPPGRGEAGAFAAEAVQRILEAYEEYYAIEYPLSKLDLVAVADHAFGAMENWGAITVRDTLLLVDELSPSSRRPEVFATLSHEIAHQWFGNLVTMKWWDDLWLNEGFATFIGAKIADRLAPEFDPFDGLILRPYEMRDALDGDSLRTTHPSRMPVEGPDEVGQVTDEITYGKASSVVRMLDAYLGESGFREGVAEYLARFRFGNARAPDLWESLGRSTKVPVASIAGPWVERAGLPVVYARLGPAGLELRQSRFAYGGSSGDSPWPIPLVIDIDGRLERFLLDSSDGTVPVAPSATVHMNPGALGFYRVRYDPTLYDRLLQTLPNRPSADRWIVLNDLAAFVFSGDVEWPTFARFVQLLGNTTDRLVAEELINTLTEMALLVPESPDVPLLACRFLEGLTDRMGLEHRSGEPRTFGIMRDHATLARAKVDTQFARLLSERFGSWDHLDPDLKGAVAIARARTGGENGWNDIRRALGRSPPSAEAEYLENALAWSGDASLVALTLDLLSSGALIQDHVSDVIANAARNSVGRPLVQTWLERQLPGLRKMFQGSPLHLVSILERSIPFAGLGRFKETAAFYRDTPIPEAANGVAKGLERLEIFERFRARRIG